MKKYKVVKTNNENSPYVFYTRSCLFFWKRQMGFQNIKGLLRYIHTPPYFLFASHKNIEWICPEPQIKDWKECCFNLDDYIILSSYNKELTDTADRTLVLNETSGQYLIENKPYNSYEYRYQEDYCLPLWSREKLPSLLEELKKVKAKDDQVIRVRTKYFHNKEQYAQWRNCYPKYKIISFSENYGCHATYEYKRADGSCDWEDRTKTDDYIQWINNIFDDEKRKEQ